MKTKNCIVLLVMSLLFSGFVISETAIAFQEIEVSVVGLSIAKKDSKSKYGGSMIPGAQSGTIVYLSAHLPGKTVIKIKHNEKKEFDITDSTGKTLPYAGLNFGFMANISDDGKTIQVPIASKELPAKGADSIQIKGIIDLICGVEPKTEVVEVEIATGKKMKLGGIEFEVTSIQDSYKGADGQMFELQSSTSPDQIQSIKAILADGKRMELQPRGSSEFGFGNRTTFGRNYDVECKVADIKKLEISYFQSVETVELPLEVNVRLGF